MNYTVKRWHKPWDFESEEKWLNKMSKDGKALVSVRRMSYEFEVAPPDEYTFRIELMDNSINDARIQQYIRLQEESGIEYLGGFYRWVYFRRKSSRGGFNHLSDIDSKIRMTRYFYTFTLFIAFFNFYNSLYNLYLYLFVKFRTTNLVATLLSGCLFVVFGLIAHRSRRYLKRLKNRWEL